MGRKGSIFGSILMIGGAAAVGYLAYRNKDLIRNFFENLISEPNPEEEKSGEILDFQAAAPSGEPENHIVIDRTADAVENAASKFEEAASKAAEAAGDVKAAVEGEAAQEETPAPDSGDGEPEAH